MTNARKQISGRYPDDDLGQITRRIAWSETTPVEIRKAQEADLRALAEEVRELLEGGAEGVLVCEGEVEMAWDWGVVEILRDQAEDEGREEVARLCSEALESEDESRMEEHRRAVWDLIVEEYDRAQD